MTPEERSALAALRFDVAPTPDDIWQPSPFDVPELHARVVEQIFDGMAEARYGSEGSPRGVIVEGRAGAGKTHMLGAVRERIQREDGGYFFLVKVTSGKTFWENTAIGILDGLTQRSSTWGMQLKTFMRRLTASLGIPAEVRDAAAGDAPLTRDLLDTFIRSLRMHAGLGSLQYLDTARALVLYGSPDFVAQDVGLAHLISVPGDPAERTAWGLSAASRNPQEIVEDISRLLALTRCPTVIAVDQVDQLFALSHANFTRQDSGLEDAEAAAVGPVADGLLALRDVTLRTLVVVSILPDTYVLLKKYAPTPVLDRFRETVLPSRIPSPELGQELVAKRFTARFHEKRYSAPYATWPIRPEAFADAPDFTPRNLLRRIDKHITQCLSTGVLSELVSLTEGGPVVTPPPVAPVSEFDALDRRFAELVAEADVAAALHHTTEDTEMPALLAAGLAAWIDEQTPSGTTFKHDPLPSAKPALHGRLIEVIDEATDHEAHWAFRAIAHPNANATMSRIRLACTTAGVDAGLPQRRLVLLRNGNWPSGKKTAETVESFLAAGGQVRPIDEYDLKVFAALRDMRAHARPGFGEWLVARRPASRTTLLSDVLGDRTGMPDHHTAIAKETTTGSVTEKAHTRADTDDANADPHEPSIGLGRTVESSAQFVVNLESLRRHTVIFAGSGSGKTVLIRRLVEECARQGVSSIVLDPNNDLARLGDAWPEEPDGWGSGDAERAKDYLDNTDVVIWTPRLSAGRPLTFQPLPDFGPLLGDPDEFDKAIEAAVAALAPRAKVDGRTKTHDQGRAVLKEALLWYARQGHTDLRGFADLLSDLPEELTSFAKGTRLAHDAGETLKAAMFNDPLFGGSGTPVDPGILLTPVPGKRARVSVISFVGLTSDEQRQSFVNQLQMALFAWIKRNPAGDRPLGGLFVMDEAQTLAPSSGNTPCTASSIALASQARKYGLGLVFATQAPKGLHNQISGNATTQFFGLLNAPAQIDAAKELAAAKNGRVPDIGILRSGQFYAAGEGFSFVKVRTPLCLTHHPRSPLSPEEVIERTRR
ncbi:ATP-binding protein [Luedemannella helvata]|uniref:DUF87 domain-containing protein n=1 Tax=Luedemannella helvata TaxID=349315 RepID=A0ABP4X6I7_9ACTN